MNPTVMIIVVFIDVLNICGSTEMEMSHYLWFITRILMIVYNLYNLFLLEKRFNQPYTTWISIKPALIQRGSSGPIIQPHTTAVYQVNGGHNHGLYWITRRKQDSSKSKNIVDILSNSKYIKPYFSQESSETEPDLLTNQKPRIVIFEILLIDLKFPWNSKFPRNFRILISKFWSILWFCKKRDPEQANSRRRSWRYFNIFRFWKDDEVRFQFKLKREYSCLNRYSLFKPVSCRFQSKNLHFRVGVKTVSF